MKLKMTPETPLDTHWQRIVKSSDPEATFKAEVRSIVAATSEPVTLRTVLRHKLAIAFEWIEAVAGLFKRRRPFSEHDIR